MDRNYLRSVAMLCLLACCRGNHPSQTGGTPGGAKIELYGAGGVLLAHAVDKDGAVESQVSRAPWDSRRFDWQAVNEVAKVSLVGQDGQEKTRCALL